MNVIIFGATGMVGQAALLACLQDPSVERIVLVVRKEAPQRDERITQIVHENFYDFAPLGEQFAGLDACLFCLGVTSVGKKEHEYRRITYDITIAAASVLAEGNPGMVFEYVSGSGTDSTERGRLMWARVKGATENALHENGPACVRNSARLDPADARHSDQDALVPGAVSRGRVAVSGAQANLARLGDHFG